MGWCLGVRGEILRGMGAIVVGELKEGVGGGVEDSMASCEGGVCGFCVELGGVGCVGWCGLWVRCMSCIRRTAAARLGGRGGVDMGGSTLGAVVTLASCVRPWRMEAGAGGVIWVGAGWMWCVCVVVWDRVWDTGGSIVGGVDGSGGVGV